MIDLLLAALEKLRAFVDARVLSEQGWSTFGVPATVLLATLLLEIAGRRNWRVRYGSRSFGIDVVYFFFYYGGVYHFLLFMWLYRQLVGLVEDYAPWLQMNLLQSMPGWAQVVVMIVVFDFFGYWSHRLRHSSVLWPFHAIHHSQTKLTVMTNYRFHFVDETVLRLCIFIPFQMLGTGIEMWLLLDFVLNWILLLQHSEWDWTYGRMGRVFVSPVFHRKHHSTDERLGNSNYGMLFTWWDDLFGTADRTSPCPSTHGLAGNPVPETLWGQLVYPFVELRRLWRRPAVAPAAAVASAADE